MTNALLVNLTSSSAAQLGQKAGQAIDTAVAAGANQVLLQFTASNSLMSSLNSVAPQGAVASAADQAHVIADSLGVNVTGVISAVEGYSQSYYPMPTKSIAAVGSVTAPLIPGTEYESASVTIVYSIN